MMDNEKIIRKIILVLVGIVISITGAMIWVNEGYEKGGLLQLGEIYDFSEEELRVGTESCVYDENSNRYIVQDQVAELLFTVTSDVERWSYFTIEIKDADTLPLSWNISFLNSDGKELYSNTQILRLGRNHIQADVEGKVQTVKITMSGQAGYTFRIADMKLRQKYFDVEDLLKKTLVLFVLNIVIYILIISIRCHNWYDIIDILQNFYIDVGDALGKRIAAIFTLPTRGRLRTCCFTIMFLLTIIMNLYCGQNYYDNGRYWIFGFGILWIFIGLLSWKKPLQKLEWKNGICLSWLLLWILVCVSDLFVMKSFSYIGYIMIFCVGVTVFIWHNNTKGFQQGLYAMMRGLEWTLPVITIFCVLFRGKKQYIYYNGCFLEHESMAMYSLAMLIAFLAECNLWLHQKVWSQKRIVVSGLGVVLSAFYLYLSRTNWCMLAAIFVMLIWLAVQLANRKVLFRNIKKLIISSVLIIAGGLILVFMIGEGIQRIPVQLETDISFEGEVKDTMLPMELIYAMEVQQPGWSKDVVCEKEENVEDIWKTYIQKVNVVGNTDNLRINEVYLNPFNGIIQMMYRYGIFIVIPYMLLLIQAIYIAFREKKFWRLGIVSAFVIVLMGENIELPFTQPLWIMFYIGTGGMLGNSTSGLKDKNDEI